MNAINQDLENLQNEGVGGGTINERSHSFIDDIMEGIEDPANDPIMAIRETPTRLYNNNGD